MSESACTPRCAGAARRARCARLHWWRIGALGFAVLGMSSLGCGVSRTVINESANAPVSLRASEIPDGAEALGFVEASAQGDLDTVLAEFALRVIDRGGNFGKIDSVHVSFETENKVRKESSQCGENQTCTREVEREVERMVTVVSGRAFKVKR